MDTSGQQLYSIILFIALLSLFVNVAIRMLPGTLRRRPIVTAILTVVIGVPSLLQFAFPGIASALDRQPSLTLHDGQWWRVLTALMAQDGGIGGAIFNLVVVAAVAYVSERVWGRWRTVVLFLLPSIVLNLLAIGWNEAGGGSSFANDGLLASICGLALLVSSNLVAKICSAAVVLVGVALVALGDAHGVAVLLGTVLGLAFGLPRILRARSHFVAESSPSDPA